MKYRDQDGDIEKDDLQTYFHQIAEQHQANSEKKMEQVEHKKAKHFEKKNICGCGAQIRHRHFHGDQQAHIESASVNILMDQMHDG